jgi:hypothetical protein
MSIHWLPEIPSLLLFLLISALRILMMGTYFVGFIIDQDDEVAESDEDDNNDCFFNEPTITFPLVGDPNLSCNNSGTLTVESGLVTIADLEILNSGDGPAGASFVGVYLSTNTTFTEGKMNSLEK